MDISQVWIDALNGLAVQHCLQAQHTVGSWVLRTDVDHIVVGAKQAVLLALQVAILVEIELQSVVGLVVVLKCVLVVKLPVLAEWVTLEVVTQEESTHIGMPQEHDTVEVEYLALQQVGHLPDVRYCWDVGHRLSLECAHAIALHAVATNLSLGQHLYAATLMGLGVLQNVDTSQTLFCSEVLAYDGNKIVKALLVLQVQHLRGELVKIE